MEFSDLRPGLVFSNPKKIILILSKSYFMSAAGKVVDAVILQNKEIVDGIVIDETVWRIQFLKFSDNAEQSKERKNFIKNFFEAEDWG